MGEKDVGGNVGGWCVGGLGWFREAGLISFADVAGQLICSRVGTRGMCWLKSGINFSNVTVESENKIGSCRGRG
jgi:hypothetical protein